MLIKSNQFADLRSCVEATEICVEVAEMSLINNFKTIKLFVYSGIKKRKRKRKEKILSSCCYLF